MQKSQVDAEFCMLHRNGQLKALMCKHVDDLKITGEPAEVQYIIDEIGKVFGQLKVEKDNFTNCGVRHMQDPRTMEISLDQVEYAKNLRLIGTASPRTNAAQSSSEPWHI